LGHHVLGHGSKWDEYLGEALSMSSENPQEWAADRFASYLLMPKRAVVRSFARRGWDPAASLPAQVLVVASELGVGYAALVNQMRWSLGLLDARRTDELRKLTPKAIREAVAQRNCPGQLLILDEAWARKAVDIQAGDFVLLPLDVEVKGKSLRLEGTLSASRLFLGACPGIAQVVRPGTPWGCFVRVSKKDYAGRATFRHLENPDAE